MSTRIIIRSVFACSLLVLVSMELTGQLSPGDLTSAHAELEGLSHCTDCHTLGDKVSNDKCLDCHNFIRDRIRQNRGYHASAEVRNKDCFQCHSEHHGRKFEITRFDTGNFDHTLTGYELTGEHKNIDCRQCHKPDFVADRELKSRKNTFLGLDTECVACHDDYHQGTLSQDCASCHTTDNFAPAANFDHSSTDFPLLGRHTEVECTGCHRITQTGQGRFQEFAGIAFATCAACNDDVHDGRLGTNCAECHNERSFNILNGQGAFNHSRTGFPLLGRHSSLDCRDCHTASGAETAFTDFMNKDVSSCVACHEDIHNGRFGEDCRQCHTEQTFLVGNSVEAFDHGLTDFALEGKHALVDCRECHAEKLTDPLPHDLCRDCHQDFHDGQLTSVAQIGTTDCADCHTVDGFEGSSFAIDDHNLGVFPLTGAHLATPCFACHLTGEDWTFRDIGTNCADCHEDIHEGYLDTRFYQDKGCAQCHITDSWHIVDFPHEETGFKLEGKHATIRCAQCHNPDAEILSMAGHEFGGLASDCSGCHEDIHRSQFEEDGTTECRNCHGFDLWKPSEFDHDSAAFALDGAHLNVACIQCHEPVSDASGEFVLYKIENFECASCHN